MCDVSAFEEQHKTHQQKHEQAKNLEVWIRRDAKEYNLSFAGGLKRG